MGLKEQFAGLFAAHFPGPELPLAFFLAGASSLAVPLKNSGAWSLISRRVPDRPLMGKSCAA